MCLVHLVHLQDHYDADVNITEMYEHAQVTPTLSFKLMHLCFEFYFALCWYLYEMTTRKVHGVRESRPP